MRKVDEKALEVGQRAAMVSNGCGCTWGGEHVFCDDLSLPEPETFCQCKQDAHAAIIAYEAAKAPAPEPAGDAVREAAISVMASLAAAISLLERTSGAKKAAPSDRMFDQMLNDYRKSLNEARAALSVPGSSCRFALRPR